MEIREWNIGMAATIPSNGGYILSSWIIDKITEKNPDCIVLTEFVVSKGIEYFFRVLEEKEYYWFISSSTKQNGILIALKKKTYDFIETMDYGKSNVNTNEILSGNNQPDYYEITVGWEGKPLTIIGTRIRVDLDSEESSFKQDQFKALDDRLSSIKNNVICVGDFNAYWPGIWKTPKNYMLPKTSKTYSLYTPQYGKGKWYSYVGKNNKLVQLDHLITNITGKKIEVKYDWDFLNPLMYGHSISSDSYKPSGLPDHAILKAMVREV